MYGTNVDGNKAYIALVTGQSKDPTIASPPGKAPADATNWSTSYSWASGAAISTVHDMQIWAKALATGALLKPETQKERVTWSPYAHYGLGITESIKTMLGHNGAIPGYQSIIGYDVNTGATIVVLANLLVTPNVPLQQAFPADEMANLIYVTLFN